MVEFLSGKRPSQIDFTGASNKSSLQFSGPPKVTDGLTFTGAPSGPNDTIFAAGPPPNLASAGAALPAGKRKHPHLPLFVRLGLLAASIAALILGGRAIWDALHRPKVQDQFLIGSVITTTPTILTVGNQKIEIPSGAALWSMQGPMGEKIPKGSKAWICLGQKDGVDVIGSVAATDLSDPGGNALPVNTDRSFYHQEECARSDQIVSPDASYNKGPKRMVPHEPIPQRGIGYSPAGGAPKPF